MLAVLRIGEKSDLTGLRRDKSGHLRNDDRTIPLELSAQVRNDLVETQPLLLYHVAYLLSAAKALMIFSVMSSFGLAQTTS